MSAELVTVNNNAVIRDSDRPWRWFGAWGPSVTRWEFYPTMLHLASTTSLSGYTHTAMTSGNMTLTAGAPGGEFVITAGAGDNQGGQIQALGEQFYFAAPWPCYFGACVAVNDADQTDIVVGLGLTDASAIDDIGDGIYFRSVDESAVIYGCTEKDGSESTSAVGTMLDATYMTIEFYFDGTEVTFYVNGEEAGSTLYSSSTFPNDEYLTPTIAFLTGAAAANTLGVRWAKAYQVREM